MATVETTYNIDEDTLADKSEESDYWGRSYSFYQDVRQKDVDSLSSSQTAWLDRIEKGLNR
jgi:hypothetical protein